MTDKLDLILKKLGKLDELTDIVYSLRDGQEELKAQFDSLTITVAKVQGDITKMQSDITAIKEGQQRIADKGITLEEYLNAAPVFK